VQKDVLRQTAQRQVDQRQYKNAPKTEIFLGGELPPGDWCRYGRCLPRIEFFHSSSSQGAKRHGQAEDLETTTTNGNMPTGTQESLKDAREGRTVASRANRLDTEHFRLGWHDQTHATDGDLLRLQGLLANQLPHPGLNPIEATQYQHRSLYTRGPPPRHGLELGHYLVEPETEVRLDVIGVI